MKIVILDAHTTNPGDVSWSEIAEQGELTVYPRSSEAEVLERIADSEAILINKCRITEDVLEHAPKLKYIGMLSTGYDVLDLEAIRQRGIAATNVPGYSSEAVAQLTFAHILEIFNAVGAHNASVQAGEWSRSPDFCYTIGTIHELSGKSLGLVGFGQIGQAVAKIALAFGLEVWATHSSQKTAPEIEGKVQFKELEEVLGADIVSLHCPLTEKTRDLINRESLEHFKTGAVLINTARGPLIDSEAVAEALKSGKLGACGLDVYTTEPISEDAPLLGLDNCYITPHIAWAAQESRERLIHLAAENLAAFRRGEKLNRLD